MLQIGSVINNRYKILQQIGQGGMGKVFLAEHTELGNKWAVKEINLAGNLGINLLAEPEMLKKLNHPALPRIVDIFTEPEYLYIVEDYFEGANLAELLKDREYCHEANVIKWAKELAEILTYLHNLTPSIIYRDMKPGNIIIDKNQNVKLIDFGIAREYKEGQNTDTTYIGTQGYASPEQFGSNQTDQRSDLYSLGVTLYHVLTGKSPNEPPYEFVPVRQLNAKLSEGIEKIIYKCTRNNPDERYQSAAELLHALHNIHKLNKDYKVKKLKKASVISLIVATLAGTGIFANAQFNKREEAKFEEIQSYIETGDNYYKQQKFSDAEQAYQQALNMEENDRLHLKIAKVYLAKGDNEKVIDYLIKRLIKPGKLASNGELHYLLGTAYYNIHDFQKSVYYFTEALDSEVGSLGGYRQDVIRDLAVSYGKLQQFDKANEVLGTIANEQDSQGITHYIKGELHVLQGEFTYGMEEFTSAINIEPNNLRYTISLADLYLKMINTGQVSGEEKAATYEKAITLLSKGKNLDSTNIEVLNSLGSAYYEYGLFISSSNQEKAKALYSEALSAFQALVSMGLEDENILLNIGILEDNLGNSKTAEENFKKALEFDPDYSRANLVLGLHLLKQKRYEQAYPYLKKTVEVNQNPGEASIAQQKINELKQKGWIK